MGWRKGYVYEFNGMQWIELDPALPGNREKYMAALMDLLKDAPNGQFNTLFCLHLIAQEAFVKYLEALEITLSELTENGKTQMGSIKSQNYRAGVSGFKIDYSGDAEFNNAVFRGHVEADSGYFRGRIEADEGFFRGLLETTVLRASTEEVYSDPRTYAAGTTTQSVIISERSFWGIGSGTLINKNIEVDGTFLGRPVKQIHFYEVNGRPMLRYNAIVITFADDTTAELWDQEPLPSGGLTFRRVTAGWNIQMRNLPTSDPRIANVLWRDGTDVKISVV